MTARLSDEHRALARAIFAKLLETYSQKELAQKLRMDQGNVSIAKTRGTVGPLPLLRAAKLAGWPDEQLLRVLGPDIDIAGVTPGAEDLGALRAVAAEIGAPLERVRLAELAVGLLFPKGIEVTKELARELFAETERFERVVTLMGKLAEARQEPRKSPGKT